MIKNNDLALLGYCQNWLEFEILTPELFALQLANFQQGDNKNSEHFRYSCLLDFIRRHEHFSDLQIKNFITLVEQDSDNLMAGSALKFFYECGKLTPSQFKTVEQALLSFGEWTAKFIEQNRLMTALEYSPLTADLVHQCIDFKEKYKSKILLQIIIEKTDDKAILEVFTTDNFGKKIRNLAKQKLK